ncbi:uncharacterized protein K489DRAFT_305676, partial [Dissoconium aciculare CBS 342.82]|uniref:TRAF-like signal transducer n=1 Tax=Dissoconium aciculare CBS 342.82 TaxID=1314786 RepID=A0A6J3M928_9PEZI
DLRMIDYVATVDENLTCPICRCPFIDPVILNECDHCFCRDCIRQTWTTPSSPYSPHGPRGDCPSCRTPAKLGPRSATTKILVNILDDLLVKCPNTGEGCSTIVKRGEVQDHVTIYCGYAKIECPDENCDLPIRRKDALQGCLHVDVSCVACREELQTSTLEQHWAETCPDRVFPCNLCDASISYKDLVEHNQRLCPAVSIPCPGSALGCYLVGKKEDMESHATHCVLAKLAPVLDAQRQRMDEQEAAQKEMNRKLEIFESGFSTIQNIICPQHDVSDANTADNLPINPVNRLTRTQSVPSPAYGREHAVDVSFSNPALTNAPYTSPFHHLLSMHEALREEVNRTSTALADLDGRHSVQILNENIRMRDEIAYVGAQVAGLQRQVTWLTS